jgi:predicted HTH domain antitoxin
MCRAIDEIRDEVRDEVSRIDSIQTATTLIEMGEDSFEKIAKVSGLTLEDVQELAAEINTPA